MKTGRSFAMAVAAIIASKARACALRPALRNEAATPPKGAGRLGIEWQGFKVRFSLLKARLSSRSFLVVRGHEGANREFGKGDGCDQWFVG